MDISLPLEKMTTADKLAVMEKIWEDLCRTPESISSPERHKHILEVREKEIAEGKEKSHSLDAAQKRITINNLLNGSVLFT